MFKKIKQWLGHNTFLRNLYRLKNGSLDLIYNPLDLNDNFYDKIKNAGDRELEHQIGRLTNFKKIIGEISSESIPGDFIEFGTWRGFSLLWVAFLKERLGLPHRALVGVDGFVGLPNSEGVFEKGAFLNTSWKMCKEHVKNSRLYEISKKNIYIEKFFYSQKEAIIKRLGNIGSKKFCFVHIDCDISSSVQDIFSLLKEGDLLADRCFLLFDDYGIVASYRQTVDSLMASLEKEWQIINYSSTKLTKNFYLAKK